MIKLGTFKGGSVHTPIAFTATAVIILAGFFSEDTSKGLWYLKIYKKFGLKQSRSSKIVWKAKGCHYVGKFIQFGTG